MNVLAVGANPDDIELLCAGTLAVYAARGDVVSMAFLTNGDKGSTGPPAHEMIAIRREESRKSAAVIGAGLYPLDLLDGEVETSLPLRARLAEVMRQTQPEVVLTHHPHDYMSDHCYTSRLVFDASFWAAVSTYPGTPSGTPALRCIPPVYLMDTLGGIGFVPEEYVDITAVFEAKVEMLSQHQSQLTYMRERDGLDLLDYMTTAAKYRGYQCGVAYAEGFIPHRVYPSLSVKGRLP
jgi:LmbE family N-acetylglucosaminyl deacetylase